MKTTILAIVYAMLTFSELHSIEAKAPTNPQITKLANQAYYTAHTIAKREYQLEERRALGELNRRGVRGGIGNATLKELKRAYLENMITLLIPITENLSTEETLAFWSDIEVRLLKEFQDSHLQQHARALINYQRLLA